MPLHTTNNPQRRAEHIANRMEEEMFGRTVDEILINYARMGSLFLPLTMWIEIYNQTLVEFLTPKEV